MNFIPQMIGALSGAGVNPGTLAPFAQNQQNYSNNAKLQQDYFDRTDKLWERDLGRRSDQYTKYGLPEFMAQSGYNTKMPGVNFQLRGTNFFHSPFGMANMPKPNRQMQYTMGWGDPSKEYGQNQAPIPPQNPGNPQSNLPPLSQPSELPPPYSRDDNQPITDGGNQVDNPFPYANNNGNLDAHGRPIKGFWPGQ